MADWSKTGRKSRRKGKVFEREVAAIYRKWTGYDFQTTRNSGRTDLPGDVYCVDRDFKVHIECKHRKTWTTRDILRNNRSFALEFEKVIEEWEAAGLPILHLWCKNDDGLWLFEWASGLVPNDLSVVPEGSVAILYLRRSVWNLIDPESPVNRKAIDALFGETRSGNTADPRRRGQCGMHRQTLRLAEPRDNGVGTEDGETDSG